MSWALVTGGAKRIGRAIALQLAEDGWDIILHYNTSSEDAAHVADEIIDLEQQVVLAEIDLTNAELVARLISSLSAQLGPITALVNNASLFERDEVDPTGALHMAINATAPRLLSEALVAQMPPDITGSIVNILDGTKPEEFLSAYAKSKAILTKDTLDWAKKFAPHVRVNGVAPGPILPNKRQSDAHFQAQVGATPLKHPIIPKDIARAVSFLLSSPAITGEILHVDGGLHVL